MMQQVYRVVKVEAKDLASGGRRIELEPVGTPVDFDFKGKDFVLYNPAELPNWSVGTEHTFTAS